MEQRPAIFKLNLDCFDHVFDYLALEDLGQFSQTCKAMKRAVGEYYQANYGTINEHASPGKDNLYLADHTIGYSDFVQDLYVYPDGEGGGSEASGVKRDSCRKVRDLELHPMGFTKHELHQFEYIINNAEALGMDCYGAYMEKVFYEIVPSMCKSLKHLRMHLFQFENAAQPKDGNKWLLREYPTLEHLMWTQTFEQGYKINEINTFFKLNPNVRSFATDVNCLWDSRHLIIESGVKLHDLTIDIDEKVSRESPRMIRDACILLNELYEKGFYKRLHLMFTEMYNDLDEQFIQQVIDQIIPINVVRSISLPTLNVNLSKLVNLVELQCMYHEHAVMQDVDVMAKYLVNLERVDFEYAHLKEMLSFTYHSVKLKKLRVYRFFDRNVSTLDLANMNKRREQLLDASKVTIFIDEEVYLATKWASTLTDYRLIEMRRSTAEEWGQHFRHY